MEWMRAISAARAFGLRDVFAVVVGMEGRSIGWMDV